MCNLSQGIEEKGIAMATDKDMFMKETHFQQIMSVQYVRHQQTSS